MDIAQNVSSVQSSIITITSINGLCIERITKLIERNIGRCRQYNKIRYSNDYNYRITTLLRRSINRAFRGIVNYQSSRNIIGLNADLLEKWFKFHLNEGYTLYSSKENDIGKKLHIDHGLSYKY